MRKLMAVVFCLVASTAVAQEWEIGAIGGFGYSPKLKVRSPAGDADTGTKTGPVLGAFGGNDSHEFWSGEMRYLYRYSDLKLSAGGAEANFDAHTHIVHADFLGHFAPRGSRVRPFIAFGAGVKVLQGTGIESAGQPLGDRAALTATKEILGVADIGAGIKMDVRKHVRFRVEIRDYISPAPNKVITPAPAATLGGVWNDFIGSAAISFVW